MKIVTKICFMILMTGVILNGQTLIWDIMGGRGEIWDVAIDNDNTVVATGHTYSGSAQITTLKINETTGDTLWCKYYNTGYDEYGRSIFVDNNKNVYVAGRQHHGTMDGDIVVIKYRGSDGYQLWATTRPQNGNENVDEIHIAVDDRCRQGVFVSSVLGSLPCVWNFDNNTGACVRQVSDINVPQDGGWHHIGLKNGLVYVAGTWRENGQHMLVSTVYNYLLQNMYGDDPQFPDRNYRLFNEDLSDRCGHIGLDNFNNLYIAGTYWDGGYEHLDPLVVKYHFTGNMTTLGYFDKQWAYRYPSPDVIYTGEIVVDNTTQESFITGMRNAASINAITQAIRSDGILKWTKDYNGSANGSDFGKEIAITANRAYVAGSAMNNGTNNDLITLCYNRENGNLDLYKSYDCGGDEYGTNIAIKTAIPDYVYIAIGGTRYVSGLSHWLMVKYRCREIPSQNSYNNENTVKTRIVNDKIRLDIKMPTPTKIEVSLYNPLGQMFSKLYTGLIEDNSFELNFPKSEIPNGIYYLLIEGEDNYRQIQKLIVIR